MESSSNKIILAQYKVQILDFYCSNFSSTVLNYFINNFRQKIVKYYISDIKKNTLIIEVILKDL